MLSCCFTDGDVLAIKEHLIDELDYILVPTEGWNKLVSWYGLTEAQEPIARKVSLLKLYTLICASLLHIHVALNTAPTTSSADPVVYCIFLKDIVPNLCPLVPSVF